MKNGLLYIIGGLLLQGINFFTLPLFTRLLSVESFGIVSLYNTWLTILTIFVCLQSNSSIGVAKTHYLKEEFEEYVSNIVIMSSTIFLLWIIIFIILKDKVSKIINLPIDMIFIMLIQSFFNTLIILKTTIYIFEEKVKEKLLVSFINIFFNVVFSIIFIKYFFQSETYIGRIFGGALPTVILGLYFYISILKTKFPKIKLKYWKFCVSLTIPIIFHSLSGIILGTSDRLMLEHYKGFYETGIYSLIYNFGMIISLIWGALNSAWVPWYYENMKQEKDDIIKEYSKNYLNLFTFICVAFLILSPEFIKIMVPQKYWGGLKFLPLIIIGYYFNFLYSFAVNYEFYTKKTMYIALATTSTAIINFLLNLYFIPNYSVMGAAITTLISYFIMFVFHEALVRIRLNYSILKKTEYLNSIILLLIFSFIYYMYLDNILIRLIFLIGYLIVDIVWVLKKNTKINQIIKKSKKLRGR